jgi:branched-chain amino acid transport system permease protein
MAGTAATEPSVQHPSAGGGSAASLGRRLVAPRNRGKFVFGVLLIIGVLALLTDAQAVQASLLGLGSGSLIAALALGIVVMYRGSGVVNIAAGAMAMYASYVFNSLNTSGQLLLIGWKVDLGSAWAFLPSLIVALAVSGGIALLLYLLVFSPLRGASPVAKLVASVGLLITMQAVIVLAYGSLPIPVTASISRSSANLPSHIIVPYNQIIMTGIVIVTAAVLWAIYRFSMFGLATRAAAEDERHLSLLGLSPRLISGGNWIFAGIVVGLFGILIAPINASVDPSSDVLLVIPALAAALIGSFSSFGWAVFGGLAIGMIQGLLQYLTTKGWFPTSDGQPLPGVQEAVPLAIIMIALLFKRGDLGSRGSLGSVRLPFSPSPRHLWPKLLGAGAVGIIGFLVLSSTWRLAEINTMVGIAICLSLVILTGFVGQVSLAQMAYAGFAGFLLSKLASAGVGFPIAPLLGALGAAALGLLTAFPALRIRGVQLAVATLATGVAIQAMIFENPVLAGKLQSASVPAPKFLGLHFGPLDPTSFGDGKLPNPWFGVFCVIVVMLLGWLVSGLRSSAWGRRMLAVRANERAAAAAGISIPATKMVSFGVAAFVAGIAGALSGYRFGSVSPDYFGVIASLTFLAFAYMGGISSVTGAVIGGFLVTNGLMFTALQEWFGLSPNYSALVGGLGLVVTIVANPDGISGAARVMLGKTDFGRKLIGQRTPSATELDTVAPPTEVVR